MWWPESPTLYNLTVTLGDSDRVSSYTGFRTVSKGEVEGVTRHLLNGEFVFQFGTLDQGYWPDGLHTPPNREAMEYDLKLLKDLGFNMVRKHVSNGPPYGINSNSTDYVFPLQIKIEPDLFYESCDRLGLMVYQDMPALTHNKAPNAAQQAEFERQLDIMINEHKSYPSIVTWVRQA